MAATTKKTTSPKANAKKTKTQPAKAEQVAAPALPAETKAEVQAPPATVEQVTPPAPPATVQPQGQPAKGPGVIASIVECLKQATEKAPVNKKAILDFLCTRFPARGRDAMHKTLNIQLPGRLRKEKGLNIQKNEAGYWLA